VAGVVAREISERNGVPYVLTEHDSAYGRGRIDPAEARELRPVFAGARCRLVVSPSLGGLLERVIGLSAVPWRHVPNLLDGLFERGGAGAPGPGTGRRVLFSAGSLDSKKGFDVLLRAYARAFPESERTELRIAGSGPEGAGLQKLAADLGVAERVMWLGLLGRDAMLQEMRTATCFVLASRTETFGVVVIEALACGRPVVATASGGPESIVVPGDGFVVPVEDVEALAAALDEVLRSPEAWDAEAIRRRCLERFGETAVVAQLIDVYREALA
jgi:glycosyltransferase involved in cell wall biosynthesis